MTLDDVERACERASVYADLDDADELVEVVPRHAAVTQSVADVTDATTVTSGIS